MIYPTSNTDQMQFVYRGITASRSMDGAKPPRWTAEIRRGRGYEFLRAASVAIMQQQIDASLARQRTD